MLRSEYEKQWNIKKSGKWKRQRRNDDFWNQQENDGTQSEREFLRQDEICI